MFFPRPRATLYLLVFFFLISYKLCAQVVCTPVYINEYKGSDGGPLQPHAVKGLPDGTYLVAGRAALSSSTTYDGFVSKYAADGTQLWSYFIGGAANDDITGITPLNDGSFLLYGVTGSFGYAGGKGWLVHIDGNGKVLWSWQLGASTTGTDRIKAIQQYPDGDLVGTLNVNDSSTASDPVVFKMGLDGTIRWTQRFDNGSDDSFTTLAITGDTVYAGGYSTVSGLLVGVLCELQAETGEHLSTRNIGSGDPTFNAQVTGLQIYNNTISFGLYLNKGVLYYGGTNSILLIQTDLAGNMTYCSYAQDVQGFAPLRCIRTQDGGFYILRTDTKGIGAPTVDKVNSYGYQEWGLMLFGNINFANAIAYDMTADGGCVAAGHYTEFTGSAWPEVMRLVKMTANGEVASCTLGSEAFPANSSTYTQAAFTWAANPAFSVLSAGVSPVVSADAFAVAASCTGSICVDHTPIPAGCGKTYNIEYGADKSTEILDIVATPDGGRVGVGAIQTASTAYGITYYDGLVTKYQSNGDIAWTKNYNIPGETMQLRRVLRTADGNLLALGTIYYIADHYVYDAMILLKLDNNGSIIWVHYVSNDETEMVDAAPTPDNGFVVALLDNYGSGDIQYNFVQRFDANGNKVWATQVNPSPYTANYKAITCTQDAVFVAYDSYAYTYDEFGVDRLDLNTGALVYSKRYSAGAGTNILVNNIFASKDSAYIFLYRNSGNTAQNMLFGLDQQGNIVRALDLGADPVNPFPEFASTHLDGAVPSVTMTADQDFWLASRVNLAGTSYMEVTRLKQDGTVELSKLHAALNNYLPYNVRPQGKGLIVVGAAYVTHSGNGSFSNGFVLKLDSSGQLQTGAAANCLATDRPFTVTPCTTCGPVTIQPPYAGATQIGTPSLGVPYVQDNDTRAILSCFQPGNCANVNLLQRGAVCAVKDTMVYYLDKSGNCGAAATWSYDTSFFQPGIISGDSIELIVQKAGSTTVGAQVEGYCSLTNENVPANIVFSGLTGLGLTPDTVICNNGPINLQATKGFATYVWNDNSTGSSLQVVVPGQYSLVATDLCGKSYNAAVNVTDANAVFHVTSDTVKCNNDVDPLQATTGYSDYQWSPATDLQAQDNKALVWPDVTTRYTVSALRSPGCNVSASVLVTTLASPQIKLGDDTTICTSDSVLLDGGTGFNSYAWSNGASTSQIYVRDPGTYSVAALYNNGCVSRDTFTLQGLYTPKPVLNKDSIFCIGEPRMLDAGGSFSAYLWSDGSTGPTVQVSGTGEYWVRVTDEHGCTAADTVHVSVSADPPAGFLPTDTTVCQYGGLKLTTREPYDSYSWSDLSSAASITVNQPGTYWLEVTDNNGCTATDTVVVTQKFCLIGVFVPNAFTPDGNGHNDLLRPLVYGDIKLLDFEVFDRWGMRVFETQTVLNGWDGTIRGTPASAGTYVWFCKYQAPGGSVRMEKGTAILIR
ncbi:MAG TPA: gliding motility-associated C-terminal domain-containing protein [Puia sp.]|nr:gliding motility-associated C-terminal domain-containing protein [Puia sp.]